MQKVIVTGGAGFIGSNLVEKLIEKGWGVTVLDDLSTGKQENVHPHAYFVKTDLSTMKNLESPRKNVWRLFDGVDVVFHLAAKARVQPSIVDPVSFNKVNIDGTLNVSATPIPRNERLIQNKIPIVVRAAPERL